MEAPPPIEWWEKWVEEALATLDSLKVLRSLRPICLRNDEPAFQVFDEMQQWDRSSVEVEIGETTFRRWMHDTPSSGKLVPLCNFFFFLSCFFHVRRMLAMLLVEHYFSYYSILCYNGSYSFCMFI